MSVGLEILKAQPAAHAQDVIFRFVEYDEDGDLINEQDFSAEEILTALGGFA